MNNLLQVGNMPEQKCRILINSILIELNQIGFIRKLTTIEELSGTTLYKWEHA